MTTPTAPVLTVTWDTVIGARHVGYDPDSGPEVEPVSLGEMVVAGLVDRLVDDVKRGAAQSDYRGTVQRVSEAATEAARDEARRMVAEALNGEIRLTNLYGEPKSEPTTLRDLIRAEVKTFLEEKPPRPGYTDRERPGGFRELLRHEVGSALAKELQDEIRAARAQVAAAVRERAAEILGDVVKRETR